MATLTWRHYSTLVDDSGVAWLEFADSVNYDSFGGWAEANAGIHTTCTPTAPSGHDAGLVPLVGTYAALDYPNAGDVQYHVGFAAPPGSTIRVHIWGLVS